MFFFFLLFFLSREVTYFRVILFSNRGELRRRLSKVMTFRAFRGMPSFLRPIVSFGKWRFRSLTTSTSREVTSGLCKCTRNDTARNTYYSICAPFFFFLFLGENVNRICTPRAFKHDSNGCIEYILSSLGKFVERRCSIESLIIGKVTFVFLRWTFPPFQTICETWYIIVLLVKDTMISIFLH